MQFIAPNSFVTAGNLAVHLHPAHIADLRKSGLKDETIRAAGLYSLPPCDISLFFNLRRGVPSEIESALCFPYQGATFARIKLFPSVAKMKYAQPPKTGARLYVPFSVKESSLVVIEGEKKTLAAQQAGLNAVGIGGLWTWLIKGTSEPIGDLKLVEWEGREVTLIPDSDAWNRLDLLRAAYALGRELQSRGAKVCVAQIPQLNAAKVGLDDFLLAGGKVSEFEVFSLSHRRFKAFEFWHGQWKFKKALKAA